MSATIQLGPVEATITDYVWSSDDEPLAEMLNARLPPGGHSGDDPNPDYTAALEAAEALGGEVLRFDEVEYVAGRVY
jgi:hypothetical protein